MRIIRQTFDNLPACESVPVVTEVWVRGLLSFCVICSVGAVANVGIAPSGMNSTSAGWLMIRSGAGRKREVTSVQASVAHGIFRLIRLRRLLTQNAQKTRPLDA